MGRMGWREGPRFIGVDVTQWLMLAIADLMCGELVCVCLCVRACVRACFARCRADKLP